MGRLHSIDENNILYWHCDNPACDRHNCQNWSKDFHCAAHEGKTRPEGQTNTTHIHELSWVAHDHMMLPPCPGCGRIHFLRVASDEEAEPAQVQRDATGRIEQVMIHEDHPAPHHIIVEKTMRKRMPTEDELATFLQAALQSNSHDELIGNIAAFQQTLMKEEITQARLHPAVILHRQAAQLLSKMHPRPKRGQ